MTALPEGPREDRGPAPEAPEVLADGRISLLGRIVGSSNATFLVRLGDEDAEELASEHDDAEDDDPDDDETDPGLFAGITPADGTFAVYKPEAGERPLHDFPPGLFRRERAAYLLGRHLGWDLVPPTLIREDAPWGIGSLQLFVPHDPLQNYFTLYLRSSRSADDVPVVLEGFGDPWELGLLDPAPEAPDALEGVEATGEQVSEEPAAQEQAAQILRDLRRLAIFDILANNTDRKAGHVLHGSEGGLHAIDNGLCFSAEMKLRTVIWDFAGQDLTDEEIEALWTIIDEVPAEIAELLSADEARALQGRARWLAAVGELPGDATGMMFPWPLI